MAELEKPGNNQLPKLDMTETVEAAVPPETKAEADIKLEDPMPEAPAKCPVCGHDPNKPTDADSIEITDAIKAAFARSLLLGEPFCHEFVHCNGKIKIRLRELLQEHEDAIGKAMKDQFTDKQTGIQYWESTLQQRYNEYYAAMAVDSIIINDKSVYQSDLHHKSTASHNRVPLDLWTRISTAKVGKGVISTEVLRLVRLDGSSFHHLKFRLGVNLINDPDFLSEAEQSV